MIRTLPINGDPELTKLGIRIDFILTLPPEEQLKKLRELAYIHKKCGDVILVGEGKLADRIRKL